MPPDAVEALERVPSWVPLLKDIGLTGWLILSIWALLFRKVITRQTYDEQRADDTRELTERLTYVEARRQEEREGRIAAEKRVSELTERWERALTLLGSIERELIRGGWDRVASLLERVSSVLEQLEGDRRGRRT